VSEVAGEWRVDIYKRVMMGASRFEGRADEEPRGLGVGCLTCGRFGATCVIATSPSSYPFLCLPKPPPPSSNHVTAIYYVVHSSVRIFTNPSSKKKRN